LADGPRARRSVSRRTGGRRRGGGEACGTGRAAGHPRVGSLLARPCGGWYCSEGRRVGEFCRGLNIGDAHALGWPPSSLLATRCWCSAPSVARHGTFFLSGARAGRPRAGGGPNARTRPSGAEGETNRRPDRPRATCCPADSPAAGRHGRRGRRRRRRSLDDADTRLLDAPALPGDGRVTAIRLREEGRVEATATASRSSVAGLRSAGRPDLVLDDGFDVAGSRLLRTSARNGAGRKPRWLDQTLEQVLVTTIAGHGRQARQDGFTTHRRRRPRGRLNQSTRCSGFGQRPGRVPGPQPDPARPHLDGTRHPLDAGVRPTFFPACTSGRPDAAAPAAVNGSTTCTYRVGPSTPPRPASDPARTRPTRQARDVLIRKYEGAVGRGGRPGEPLRGTPRLACGPPKPKKRKKSRQAIVGTWRGPVARRAVEARYDPYR